MAGLGLVHCHDAMIYLGQPRAGGLREYPDAFIDSLDPEGSAVAYLFRCPRCGTHGAIWDAD